MTRSFGRRFQAAFSSLVPLLPQALNDLRRNHAGFRQVFRIFERVVLEPQIGLVAGKQLFYCIYATLPVAL